MADKLQALVIQLLMRPASVIAAYFAAIFIGGALLAPWIHGAVQLLAESVPALKGLAGAPLHRYVSRCFIIIGVVGLLPVLRQLGIRNWREVGLAPYYVAKKGVSQGLAFGFLSLAIVVGLVVMVGVRGFVSGRSDLELVKHFFNATSAALLVAALEELFFRGVVFGALKRQFSWQTALLISSGVYALLHFFARVTSPTEVHWWSGLALLPHMMRGFGDVEQLVPGFFNLLLAGIMLGLAYHRTGNLGFSFGLHAGWIFWLKGYGYFTQNIGESNTWLWGTGKLIDGWAACGVLLLVLVSMLKVLPSSPLRTDGEPTSNIKAG